ncbi:hypothetical protein PWT90_09465 [Aphanocladium album]|nr:hypothetical protein PWT90_09465 [Aphanocladium album]
MHSVQILLTYLAATSAAAEAITGRCPPFPSSMMEFTANFTQPEPPLLVSEYRTSFIQHKWNQNLSHIASGFINNSPSKGFVRVDEVYGSSDGAFGSNLASSIFNYANLTKDGLVDNTLTTYTSNRSAPTVWRGYVNSNFPIFEKDLLVKAGAVFGGLTRRQFVEDRVAAVRNTRRIVDMNRTLLIVACSGISFVGYDYFSPGWRTRVVTEYFNILVGGTSDRWN